MKITAMQPNGSQSNQQSNTPAQDARARAIARLTQPTPVSNPNQIAPEEMLAIHSQVQQAETPEESNEKGTIEEATSEEQQAPKAETEPIVSKQLAALARREKALRLKQQQQEAAIKARQAELDAREAALNSKPSFDESKYISKDTLKSQTIQALIEAGIDPNEALNDYFARPKADPHISAELNSLKAEIKRLNEANENSQKSQQEAQQNQYQAAVKQITLDVKSLVNSDPNFETIKATNSVKDVVELIEKTFAEDGIVMSVEDAAQEVENYLMEEAFKLTRIDKIKKKLEQASTAQVKSQQAATNLNQSQKQPQPMKTLTNNAASSRKLSAKERAILAFKGDLK